MNKKISLGNSSDAPFLAFGDESKKGDVLVYAYVIFRRQDEQKIGRQIRYLKNDFGIPSDFPLHFKVLMHGDALKKKGLAHLNGYNGRAIMRRVVTLFNDFPTEVRYAFQSLEKASKALGEKIVLRNAEGASGESFDIVHSYQGHLGTLSAACLTNPSGIPASQCEFFAAEESTRVKFVGPRAQRTDSRFSGLSDIGAPRGRIFHIQPKLVKADAHFGLELADAAAYLCANALQPGEPEDMFFKEQLARIKSWRSAELDYRS